MKWQNKTPDTGVLDQADVPSVHAILMLSLLRWAGHVARMPDHRLPRRLFFSGELQQGVRSRESQKKRFKDTLKAYLETLNINPVPWEQTAMDRARWRSSIHKGASLCGERKTAAAQQKSQARKARASKQEVSHIPCLSCHRIFRARNGLISHLRVHKIVSAPLNPKMTEVVFVDSTTNLHQRTKYPRAFHLHFQNTTESVTFMIIRIKLGTANTSKEVERCCYIHTDRT